ncbi:type II secretion system F family protein, partial [Gemmiger sp.]|uniref:type II secretion system F family protein n=1 Tax=Gemmiger sp. TaxID=2049027 RepID=UPI0025B7D109
IGNRWIESQFGDALDSIRAGHSLSQAIAGIDGFETKLSSSIAVGEETGRLDSLLATISETLDYEAEMTTKRLVTLLEPVMIVIMGIVVGGVVAAVIVPIYQSYGTIGSSSGAI